jgi:hypothetical protein
MTDMLQRREVERGGQRHGERDQCAGQRQAILRLLPEHPGDADAGHGDRQPGSGRQPVLQEDAGEQGGDQGTDGHRHQHVGDRGEA